MILKCLCKGRVHKGLQTETFLEELRAGPEETAAGTQTDALLEIILKSTLCGRVV